MKYVRKYIAHGFEPQTKQWAFSVYRERSPTRMHFSDNLSDRYFERMMVGIPTLQDDTAQLSVQGNE